MSQQPKSGRPLRSTPRLLETGQKLENSIAFDCPEANVFITDNNSKTVLSIRKSLLKRKRSSSTQESLPNTKRKISSVRSKTSKSTTKNTKSSRTLPVDSIGRGPDCCPFWNDATKELSQKLLSPTGIDYVDSEWSSWSGYSRSMKSGSSFTTRWKRPLIPQENLPRTYWLSRTSLWQRTTDKEQLRKSASAKNKNKGQKVEYNVQRKGKEALQETFKCRKHKVVHHLKQVKLFKKWFGVFRWTYNQCCKMLKDRVFTKPTKKLLRSLVVNVEAIKERYPEESKWILKVPYDWRDKAIVEFLKNLQFQLSLGKSIDDFQLHFKSKKAPLQSVEIDTKHWHGGCPFSRVWNEKKRGKIAFSCKRKKGKSYYIEEPSNAVRLLYCRGSRQYLVATPEKIQVPPLRVHDDDNQVAPYNVVFLDPGVRVFQTGYDSQGRIIEMGVGYDKILKLCQNMDLLYSTTHKRTHRKRYRIWNKVLPRLRHRLKCMIDDFHWKTAKFLCENYDDIHLPSFDVSRMLKKKPIRCLNSKAARMMCNWSHYRFSQVLKYRAMTTGSRVWMANEAYTSKTCCRCGHLKPKSSSKMSFCPACSLSIDRDINGAINICLRQCTYTGQTQGCLVAL